MQLSSTEDQKTILNKAPATFDHATMHALSCLIIDESSSEDIHASNIFSKLLTKADYIEWIAKYRKSINEAELHIKSLKGMRKCKNDWARCYAQSSHAAWAGQVTALIKMRRLGKIWSRAQSAKDISSAA